jgi:hypothetical protein
MYHKISISKLSRPQILKLLKGHRVRVKHGSGHVFHASEEQHKKIMRAHHSGKGCVVQMDPYQQEMHKEGGSFGSFLRKAGHALAPIGHVLAPIAKQIAHQGLEMGTQYIKDRVGLGIRKKKHPKKRVVHHKIHHGYESEHEGEGFFGDMAKKAIKGAVKKYAPIAIDAGTNFLKKQIGSGAKRRTRGCGLYPAGYGMDE